MESDEELNPVLSGYFSKLFQVLVGNKPREVFTYVYQHPVVLHNFIKHIYDKSISEILVRLLNASDNMLEDSELAQELDGIRQSFVFKILQKLAPEQSYETHLNASQVLAELVEYKVVY